MGIPAAIAPEIQALIDVWRWDPVQCVNDLFAVGWEKAHPGRKFELELWQIDGLQALVGPCPRIAAKAAKGVGKGAWLSWVGWWFLVTRKHVRGAVVSITEGNLDDNLWPELALWRSYSPLLQQLFVCKRTVIEQIDEPGNWYLSKRAFAKDADPTAQAETLAGLHADAVLVLLDEVGSFPKGVFDAAGAIFNVAHTDAILAVAGNATDITGPLGRICTEDADRWKLIEITGDPDDPRRCSRIDIVEARALISKYGRDDPMVMVNILGKFPPRGSRKLIGPDDVSKAVARRYAERTICREAIVWGLDVAGVAINPDAAVLTKRQGPAILERAKKWRNLDSDRLADVVALEYMEDKKKKSAAYPRGRAPNKIFVDKGNTGREVCRRLKSLLGESVVEGVDFGGSALDDAAYLNRRAEMWWAAAYWLRDEGSIPDDPELRRDLTSPDALTAKKGRARRQIESKDEMRARGLPSPDAGDSLCLTFSALVLTEPMMESRVQVSDHCETDFDPIAAMKA